MTNKLILGKIYFIGENLQKGSSSNVPRRWKNDSISGKSSGFFFYGYYLKHQIDRTANQFQWSQRQITVSRMRKYLDKEVIYPYLSLLTIYLEGGFRMLKNITLSG